MKIRDKASTTHNDKPVPLQTFGNRKSETAWGIVLGGCPTDTKKRQKKQSKKICMFKIIAPNLSLFPFANGAATPKQDTYPKAVPHPRPHTPMLFVISAACVACCAVIVWRTASARECAPQVEQG